MIKVETKMFKKDSEEQEEFIIKNDDTEKENE